MTDAFVVTATLIPYMPGENVASVSGEIMRVTTEVSPGASVNDGPVDGHAIELSTDVTGSPVGSGKIRTNSGHAPPTMISKEEAVLLRKTAETSSCGGRPGKFMTRVA